MYDRGSACLYIQHGIDAVDAFFGKIENRRRMHAALGSALASAVSAFWLNTKHKLIGEIYITCVSQHWPSEDAYGRLSMWRGYCNQPDGVALVLNVEPFRLQTNEFNAYSSPVLYGHAADFEAQALQVFAYHASTLAEFLNNIRYAIRLYVTPISEETYRVTKIVDEHFVIHTYDRPADIVNEFAWGQYFGLLNSTRTKPNFPPFSVTSSLKSQF
jgi:hypothetical protein